MAKMTVKEINELYAKLKDIQDKQEQQQKSIDDLIESLQGHDEKYSTHVTDIDNTFSTIKENQETSDSLLENIENTNSNINEKSTEITELHNKYSKEYQEFLDYKNKETKEVLEKKQQLNSLIEEVEALKATTESLLPGATSAGLASAFKERKESFKVSKITWLLILISTVGFLLYQGYSYLQIFDTNNLTFSSCIINFINRLPIFIPSLFLIFYSGKKYDQRDKLEEEYAHKESTAKSFEGFKKQILDIEKDCEGKENTFTKKFMDTAIQTLAVNPARVYEQQPKNKKYSNKETTENKDITN